jgi:HD-GYP domain-containing protein (c-di-GMP phosphodiesterase class II)
MKLMKLDTKPIAKEYRIGSVVEEDLILKLSSDNIVIVHKGVEVDEKILHFFYEYEELYTENKDVESIHTLAHKEKFVHNKTLFTLIKHFKNNPTKIFRLLCDVNGQLFKDFIHSSSDTLDTFSVEVLIESLLFLIKHPEYSLKNIMPLMKDDNQLSIHSFNVTIYALILGHALKLTSQELFTLGYAALVHDAGKKAIDSIISQNKILDQEEMLLVQKHSDYSIEILQKNNITDSLILKTVLEHHEKFDGSGYPNKLKRKEIGRLSSILAIADVFDALTVTRPYRRSYSSYEALRLMITDPVMKNQFNKEYIKKLLSLL